LLSQKVLGEAFKARDMHEEVQRTYERARQTRRNASQGLREGSSNDVTHSQPTQELHGSETQIDDTLEESLLDEQRTKEATQNPQRRAEENLASGRTGTFQFRADGKDLQMAGKRPFGTYSRNEREAVLVTESSRGK